MVRGHYGKISGGEVVGEQVGGADPREGDVFVRVRRGRTGGERAHERDHLNDDGAVVVDEAGEGARDDHGAAELFLDFPHDGVRGDFAGLDFATGEFPFQREKLVRRALGEQHAALVFDQGADDGNGRRGGHVGWLNKQMTRGATFLGRACFRVMKTFLKILLLLLVALIAIKLCPLILLAAAAALLVMGLVGTLGLSLLAILLVLALVAVAVLSPIWLPVLMVVGIVALIRKARGRPAHPVG